MLAVTHLIVSLLLIQLLSLDRNDAFVAMMFGVIIDIDHLFGLKSYADANGFASIFDVDSLMNANGQWKSLLHNPVAVMIVGPISTASRIAIPLIFWGIHILMDCLEDTILGLFSIAEAAVLVSAGAILLWLRFAFYRTAHGDSSFIRYLSREFRTLRSYVRLDRGARTD